VILRASGSNIVRSRWFVPHGDWDSRKIHISVSCMIGRAASRRLQLFYNNDRASFEAPFFVPSRKMHRRNHPPRRGSRPLQRNFWCGESEIYLLSERCPPKNHDDRSGEGDEPLQWSPSLSSAGVPSQARISTDQQQQRRPNDITQYLEATSTVRNGIGARKPARWLRHSL